MQSNNNLIEELPPTEQVIKAQEYIDSGMAIVPIPLGRKGPLVQGWNERDNVVTTLDAATRITGNMGIAHAYCAPYPTAALDIDDYELAKKWLLDKGIDVETMLESDDAVLIESGRENRTKFLFQLPDDVGVMTTVQVRHPVTNEMVLEFRCASKNGKTVQDVLPPSIHPDTGKPYRWAGKGHYSNLPILPPALIRVWIGLLDGKINAADAFNIPSSTAALPSGGLSSDAMHLNTKLAILTPEQKRDLRSALFYIPADDRNVWIDNGMPLKPLGEEGRVMFMEWSATSNKFDKADAARVWDSFAPTSISYKSIFAKAQELGWLNPAKKLPENIPTEIIWPIPQKLPPALLPVPKLDVSCLPAVLKAGVVDITDRLQCPLDYVVASLIVSAGALIGSKVGIYPKEHDETWTVFPCLWGGIVGPAGSMKTPAQNEAFKVHHQLEANAGMQYKNDLAQYARDTTKYESELAKYKPSGNTLPPIEPTKPTRKRYIMNDTTYQAMGVVLDDNPNGILAHSDEMSGLLQSLDTPGQEAARGFYLSGWGGSGSCNIDRIGRGSIQLTNYCISVFGGFQPDRLRGYVRQTQSGSSNNDGLIQRFQLLVWPDPIDHICIVDRAPNKQAIQDITAALTSLAQIQTGARLHFDAAAQVIFNQWQLDNEALLRSGDLDAARQSHIAKYRSLIPALALLYHLLNGHGGDVCAHCLSSAIEFSEYLKGHSNRIYGSVQGLDHAPMLELAKRLKAGALQDGFTLRELVHKGWAELGDKVRAQGALDGLVVRGWLVEAEVKTGGRPTTKYLISPSIG